MLLCFASSSCTKLEKRRAPCAQIVGRPLVRAPLALERRRSRRRGRYASQAILKSLSDNAMGRGTWLLIPLCPPTDRATVRPTGRASNRPTDRASCLTCQAVPQLSGSAPSVRPCPKMSAPAPIIGPCPNYWAYALAYSQYYPAYYSAYYLAYYPA